MSDFFRNLVDDLKDEDGERELIPISEIVTDAVRNVKT